MIRLSPPEFGYVQVERPVISDVKPFLAQAQEVGNMVLGFETVGSLQGVGVEVAEDYPLAAELINVARPVGMPVLEVAGSNEMSLVLLHRGVPRDLIAAYGILRARRNLDRHYFFRYQNVTTRSGKVERAEIRRPGMLTDLAEEGQRHGLDPDNTPVLFNRVDIIGEPGDNFVLGLFPDPASVSAHALYRQSKIAARHLSQDDNRIRRLARPITPWQTGMPFARFPSSVNMRRYERLLGALNDLAPIRLTLGRSRVTEG